MSQRFRSERRKTLTPTRLNRPPPKTGHDELLDSVQPHLRSRVSATGHRSFTCMLRAVKLDSDGNTLLEANGRFDAEGNAQLKPMWSVQRFTYRDPHTGEVVHGPQHLDAAREWAGRLFEQVRKGEHPKREALATAAAAKEKAQDNHDNKLLSLVPTYIERVAKIEQRRWRDTESLLRRHVLKQERIREKGRTVGWADSEESGWREMLVSDINHANVDDLLWDVEQKTGPHTRNRLLAAISGFLRWSLERGAIKSWPLGRKLARKETKRDQVLEPTQMRAIWECAGDAGVFGEAIRMLMVTAQRRSEVIDAPWSEINVSKATWTIPAERNKGKRRHTVPLTETALEILKAARARCDKLYERFDIRSAYVFTIGGKTPIGAIGKSKAALDELIQKKMEDWGVEFEPWHIHSLRRTASERMEKWIGVPFASVGAVLNHSPDSLRGVTAGYTPGDPWEDKWDALAAWDRLLRLMVDADAWLKVQQILESSDRGRRQQRREFRLAIQADNWPSYLETLGIRLDSSLYP